MLGGLVAIPFYLESVQIGPSDLMTSLGDSDAVRFALRPVGISPLGWVRITLWSWLLGLVFRGLVFRGHGWARTTAALFALLRGGAAIYYAIASGFRSDLALVFVAIGLSYLLASLLLIRASDLALYLARRRARQSRSVPARSAGE